VDQDLHCQDLLIQLEDCFDTFFIVSEAHTVDTTLVLLVFPNIVKIIEWAGDTAKASRLLVIFLDFLIVVLILDRL